MLPPLALLRKHVVDHFAGVIWFSHLVPVTHGHVRGSVVAYVLCVLLNLGIYARWIHSTCRWTVATTAAQRRGLDDQTFTLRCATINTLDERRMWVIILVPHGWVNTPTRHRRWRQSCRSCRRRRKGSYRRNSRRRRRRRCVVEVQRLRGW